jgi:hypothetical protein
MYAVLKIKANVAKLVNSKLFLFLGTTGTEKEEALKRLSKWAEDQGRPQPFTIDFEDQIGTLHYSNGSLYEYMDLPKLSLQRPQWKTTFEQVLPLVEEKQQKRDVYIALHGSLIRREYGVRSVLNLLNIAKLNPDAIITLIDDIFVNWCITEKRAHGGQDQKGRPTLAQLLIGRRHEILIGDIIANFLEDEFGLPRKPHYVIALRHSVETLGRLLYGNSIKRVYVSFPISMPRKRQKQDDCNAINEINGMLQKALEFQKNHKNLVLFLPVTLDEMLLANLAASITKDSGDNDMVALKLTQRWQIPEVLGKTLRNEEALPRVLEIPAGQLREIAGLINDEILTHDFRMIDQSKKMLVLSQYCEKEKSSGVSAEIDYALYSSVTIEGYQVPAWLPPGVKWEPPHVKLKGPFSGTVKAQYRHYHTCLEDALQALLY